MCSSELAARVPPEDLRRGDDVAILNEIHEIPSFLWDCGSAPGTSGPLIRVQTWPHQAGAPLHVQTICLPFVLVETPTGEAQTLDVRQVQLVRLSGDYARRARKRLRKRRQSGVDVKCRSSD
jgi:hypothetical protein